MKSTPPSPENAGSTGTSRKRSVTRYLVVLFLLALLLLLLAYLMQQRAGQAPSPAMAARFLMPHFYCFT